MSTRIKQVLDMPAPQTTSFTVANCNTFVAAFEAVMLAAGFQRTADTGQLESVAALPASYASAGYRVYALVDEFSATSPFFLIVEFRLLYVSIPGSSATLMLRPAVRACLATDGAGNPVGGWHQLVAFYSGFTNPSGVTAQVNANKAYVWRKSHVTLVSLSPGYASGTAMDSGGPVLYTQTAGTIFFARRRNRQGAVVPGEFILYGTQHSPISSTLRYLPWVRGALLSAASGYTALRGGYLSQGLEPVADFSLKDNLPLVQHPYLGRAVEDLSAYGIAGVGTYGAASHFAPGTLVPVSVDGVNKSYMCLGLTDLGVHLLNMPSDTMYTSTLSSMTVFPSLAPISTAHGLCLDWED